MSLKKISFKMDPEKMGNRKSHYPPLGKAHAYPLVGHLRIGADSAGEWAVTKAQAERRCFYQ